MNLPSALSVGQLNLYVKSLLESDRNLKSVWLRGELSNFVRNAKSGHCYFSVKDAEASVKTVMFKWQASSLTFLPKDGMQVLLRGRVSLYERDGQYQFYAEQMLPEGLGNLYLSFLRLKSTLEAEGLFEDKLPLPAFPRRIGVCTSLTGAAVQDVLSVCSRLAPSVKVTVYPCQMQGREAPESVLSGLRYFRETDVNVVLIARGGGSYEDLAVFNDEGLARAVAAYPIPVISAIGHETDFTILDYVSDARAATPSVAAELAVGQVPDLTERFFRSRRALFSLAENRIRLEEEVLRGISSRLDPRSVLAEKSRRLENLSLRLDSLFHQRADGYEASFSRILARISAMNPMAVLSRGYALAEKDGVPVCSAVGLSDGDCFSLNFHDGVVDCVAECKKDRKL